MLTPQEVSGKEFTKAVFGGYDMAAVDDFLEAVTKDYTDLYKENAILKNKMKVLVEKVEEYRSTEDAMRMALLTAQKMAREITEEAEKKSKTLVEDAEREAHDKIEEYRAEVAAEGRKLDAAKAQTADFIKASSELISRHMEFLSHLNEYAPEPVAAAPAPASEEEKQAEHERKADEIEKSVAQIIENSANEDQPAAKTDADDGNTKVFTRPDGSKKPKFEFVNLQFGDDYDATK